MVRKLLEAALESLNGDLSADKQSSNSIQVSESTAGAPVILVLAGGSNAQGENTSPGHFRESGQREVDKILGSSIDQSNRVAHPGLERFSIIATSDSPPNAPKACFMEPGRTCVNSGACEMRGF